MHNTLCDKYGFNTAQRKLRVAMMGLSGADNVLAELLHSKIIQPYGEEVVAGFYKVLLSFPEIKAFLLEHAEVHSLQNTQLAYLQSYGVNFDSPEYFEERLQVGRVHALIGLPLSYYQMAFRTLDDLLFDYLAKVISLDDEQFLPLVKLISRVSALDMSLAIEVYHNKKVLDMTSSIDALIDERQLLTSKIGLDELTQVASRAKVLDYLCSNLEKATQKKHPFCVAMIDLDFFKSVNDKYGHLVGDQILARVAARMKSVLRTDDILGRYGGDEFLLVLPRADINVARQITERICSSVNARPFHIDNYSIPFTVSIGVADWRPDDSDETLLNRADHALYKAKDNGRNQIVLASPRKKKNT
ncbi:diguanylate cyclase/phosphodiesterase (GGDEF & EAL domains) with PAS/PAC sensor(s) [hydrothermal vent metagenome]|uniref:Diguanylate cyclase DosC n=1 Tax=hydrothermal vent metagenome TaxID=652676 RepID=A0A3B1A8V0_9ZZZZ